MFNSKKKPADTNPSELVQELSRMAKKEGISFSEAVRRAMMTDEMKKTLDSIQRRSREHAA